MIARTSSFNEARERAIFSLVFQGKKKPLHNGSYEHRVPKIKNKTFSCTRYVCVIQHPLPSTTLNAHGTNCSAAPIAVPTGSTHAHILASPTCALRGMSFKVGGCRCGNVCFYRACDSDWGTVLRFSKIRKIDQRFFVSLPGTSTSIKIYHNVFFSF